MNKDRIILMAEDDENDIAFLQRAFRQAQVDNSIQVVQDGQAAMDYLAGSGDYADRRLFPLPGLLLLDLKMPRKTGMEVLAWIRRQDALRSLPIIIFSSTVHPMEIETAYLKGANAFVTKPSGAPERTKLASVIKDFWLTFNQLP